MMSCRAGAVDLPPDQTLIGVLPEGGGGSGTRLLRRGGKTRGVDKIGAGNVGRVAGNLDDELTNSVGGKDGAEPLNEGGDVEAFPLGVGGHADRAEFGAGCELGEHGHDLMPSRPRSDSAGAYELMNRMVAFAPARPLLMGDPRRAAPLEKAITVLPGSHGTAWIEWRQQRLSCPVEHLLHVDGPVGGERPPGMVLDLAARAASRRR